MLKDAAGVVLGTPEDIVVAWEDLFFKEFGPNGTLLPPGVVDPSVALCPVAGPLHPRTRQRWAEAVERSFG